MKTNQSNAIATMVKTTQGATVKTVSAKPSLTGAEILDLTQDYAKGLLAYKSASDAQVSALEIINAKVSALHNGGVRLQDGRSKDKQTLVIKTAFIDSLGNLSKSYKQDQWELFFKAVNSGKAIKTLNKSRNKSGDAKGQKGEQSIINLIVKLYNNSDFEETFSEEVQSEILDILKREGCIEE